ncbi:Histidine kinase-like ATPase domain-containing protein [Streptomyces sp. TLI_053]|nr:Histidine kinase-like ATPase domain-containing protein [Streptomyces sp. TLI_053]
MAQHGGRGPAEPAGDPTTLVEAVRLVLAQVEDIHGVPVTSVLVGDCPLDERLAGLALAAREAMVNAARFGGRGAVSVYCEVTAGTVFLSVRDRGPGFDPASVPDDRTGIRESIIGRMRRHGGTARIHAPSDGGTEVQLEMDTAVGDSASKALAATTSDFLTWNAFVSHSRATERQNRQSRQRDRAQRQERVHRAERQAEFFAVIVLLWLATAGYYVAVHATHNVLESLGQQRFSPSDTAQIITAVGGLMTATGLSVAGILKALALLVHARADMVRAREGLPSAGRSAVPDDGDPTGSGRTD